MFGYSVPDYFESIGLSSKINDGRWIYKLYSWLFYKVFKSFKKIKLWMGAELGFNSKFVDMIFIAGSAITGLFDQGQLLLASPSCLPWIFLELDLDFTFHLLGSSNVIKLIWELSFDWSKMCLRHNWFLKRINKVMLRLIDVPWSHRDGIVGPVEFLHVKILVVYLQLSLVVVAFGGQIQGLLLQI